MRDFDSMAGLDEDECPVHGAEVVREYDFGMNDARVVKWACRCCCCFIGDSQVDDGTYHTNYKSAEGRARLKVAAEDAWQKSFA